MKRIILFSPTGYVGSLLKKYMIENEDVELFEITRNTNLGKYYGECDVMIYSAAVTDAEPLKLIQDNVLASISVIDFCRRHRVKRIIYLSTDSVYGEINIDEVSESTIMLNPDFYGSTKYLAEKVIIESGISYYILRLPGIVGGIWRRTYFYRLIDAACSHEPITLYNAEKEFNNVLHINDLIQFIEILCNCGKGCSEIFLLGNTEKVKLIKIVDYIKEVCNSKSVINFTSGGDKRYFTLNTNKAETYGYTSKPVWEIIDELYSLRKTMYNAFD